MSARVYSSKFASNARHRNVARRLWMEQRNSMRRVCATGTVCVALLSVPTLVWAQATITGTARDTSGAVLPGVTVEATSPALIEKSRTTITDDKGEYKIIELRPGTYTVTFTLPGFTTLKRDGIELAPNFTATVNAALAVGAIQ